MSTLIATISQIQKCDTLHLVDFVCQEQHLTMMSLELDKKISIGSKVKLAIKPSHVSIAKNFVGELSYRNRLKAKISSINQGKLLSIITLSCANFELESILTASACLEMNLQRGDEVEALINTSELSIREVLA